MFYLSLYLFARLFCKLACLMVFLQEISRTGMCFVLSIVAGPRHPSNFGCLRVGQ